MDDCAQIARIDVAPGIALAAGRVVQITGEIGIVLWFDHIADAQRVDVGTISHGKGARRLFIDDLGQTGAVHRIGVKADAIGRLGRGDDHLAHAKLHGGLDHVAGADDIGREGLVVRLQQNTRDRCELHDGVRGG